jgi:hypothetical protein
VKQNLDKEIESLEVTVYILEHQEKKFICEVTHEPFITGIDGKVLQHMQNNKAMSRCGICQATPTEMSIIDNIDSEAFRPNPLALLHGITPLHSMIQSFNFLKNIGCKQICARPQWSIMGDKLKKKFQEKKTKIQNDFLEKLNIRVDFPNVKGGTSTTGNVARRAFANHEITAKILNIDSKLVENFKIILYVISSKNMIKTKEFHSLCSDTYRALLTKYPWVKVSPTVHKILAHSAEIAEFLPLPLGMFGEEGSEGRNKIYRQDREHHSRQFSRLASITDVFNRAMDSSDPYIASLTSSKFKKKIDETVSDTMEKYLIKKDEIQGFYEAKMSCEEEETCEENEEED